jgi:hypothetical protein
MEAAPSEHGGRLTVDVSLERRIEILEENMEQLRDVPARLSAVESQIVQLRSETRAGFSALRAEMRVLHEEVISRIALLQEGRTTSLRKSQRGKTR